MNKLIRHINYSLLIITISLFSLVSTGFAEVQKTIYIAPFKVHAQKDISFLENAMRAMMASRLAANANLKIIENKDKADYTLHGDITAIGSSLSINAKINETDGGTPEATFYASAASENDIIPAVDTLASNISQQYFNGQTHGGQVAVPHQQSQTSNIATTAVPQANTGFQTAHPDRAFLQPGQTGSVFVKPLGITTAQGFKKTRNFPISMQDMAVGDIDGDGVDDLVMASTNEIFAYQMSGTNSILSDKYPSPPARRLSPWKWRI